MSAFGGNIEKEMKTPDLHPILDEKHEPGLIPIIIFDDDYEGLEPIGDGKETDDSPFDANAEMSKLFADDHSDGTASTDSSVDSEPKQETVDLTKQYEPNSKFEVNGHTYETDDKGTVYKIDNCKLVPNCEYTLNGATYKTDDEGRIISCDGNAKSTPTDDRDEKAQTSTGGEDRREGDQGGHIIAKVLGGAKGIENMLAMRGAAINQSVYKRMENDVNKAVADGKEVHMTVTVEYDGNSQRPSKFTVTYTIDGKDTVVEYDNDEGSTDLIDSLEDKIDNNSYNDLKQEIQDANEDGANISIVSVKTEYDEDGNVTKVTVTTRDDNSDHPVNEDRVYSPKEDA